MNADVARCHYRESLARAAQLMWERDCGCVPVVDDSDRVFGVVTDRDGFMGTYLRGKKPEDVGVMDVMSCALRSCRPDDNVAKVEQIMRENQVRRLPVVDGDGRLVGLVSLADLALHAHRTLRDRADGLGGDSLAFTLAAISVPHAAAPIDRLGRAPR